MALLAQQLITKDGVTETLAAATATTGDTFPVVEGTSIRIKNGSGAPINATFTSVEVGPEAQNEDLVIAVPAGATKDIAMDPVRRFAGGGGSANLGKVVCSAVTTVTVGCFVR